MGVYHSLVDTCTYIPTVEVIQDKEDSVKFVGVYHWTRTCTVCIIIIPTVEGIRRTNR